MTQTKKPTSAEVRAKHKEFLFPSVANYYKEPVVLESGHGARLRDLDGASYLDFFGGILTVSVGQTHEKVNAALHAQIDRLGHVSTLYPTLPIVDLAEKLVSLAPGKIKKAFFSASGTEADETAVALAQIHTGRTELVALRHGYSGRLMLAQSLTAHSNYRAIPTQIAAIKHALSPYCYRCPLGLTYPSCEVKCAKDIEELIQTTTTGQIAGFLAEPIQGVGGFITAPDGYFKVAVEIIRKYGGVFICDEVQTGFGRTGDKMWGIEHHDGVQPDIMTMAKGIANGLPIGATLATAAIADSWKAGNISTFGGNPLSAAAANATIDVIVEEKLPQNAAAMGKVLREGLMALQKKYPRAIGDVRGKGLMQALELVKDETAKDRTPAPETTLRLFEETKKRGLLIGKGGLYGNTIRVAPPLNIGKADIEEALKILDQSFGALQVQMAQTPMVLPDGRLEQRLPDAKPRYTEAEARTEAERCLFCADAPCIKACPTEIDVPTFIKKIATGNVRGAARTIFEQNILGSSCARVCPVEVLCVGSCVYTGWHREPIPIGRLQRYATETTLANEAPTAPPLLPKRATQKPRSVALVGAGPASLACAAELALAGHRAVIYETKSLPGGLNTTGIAPYKLQADDSLDEVEWVRSLGVELHTSVRVGGELSGQRLLAEHDAVFLGVGLGADTRLGIPGEDGSGVQGATAWIEQIKLLEAPAASSHKLGRVVVIGGGNTALDCARECAQLGAEEVVLLYRRGADEMSGYDHELEAARTEGVRLRPHAVPVAFVRDGAGSLRGLRIAKAHAGKPIVGTESELPCTLALVAIGQSKLHALAKEFPGVALDGRGCIVADPKTGATGNPKVFSGGDCINGGKEVVNAVADGRNAARELLRRWEN